MQFTKPFLSYDAQADLLLTRGLQGPRGLLIQHLQAVNYYRLSGYWYPFRQVDPSDPTKRRDAFYPDATVEKVWNRYVFDRRLRLLVMDAIERIEVDVRTRLAYLHAERHGPFGYAADRATLPKLTRDEHDKFRDQLRKAFGESREDFVEHFRDKYGDAHADLPVWVASS